MSIQLARTPPIVVLPPSPSIHEPATLIFLHDYNSEASRFNRTPPNDQSLAHHIHSSPAFQHLKIIIPNGLPCVHSQVRKNVWYNMDTPFPPPGEAHRAIEEIEYGSVGRNEDDMKVTMDYIEDLIRGEMAFGTPASRVVLMGYSQGATIAALFLLTKKLGAELGAVISFAGFAPTPMTSVTRMQKENGLAGRWSRETILFLLHGNQDKHVPVEIHHAWLARLEGLVEQGQGAARIEGLVIESLDHFPIVKLWPEARTILQRVVPLPRSTSQRLPKL